MKLTREGNKEIYTLERPRDFDKVVELIDSLDWTVEDMMYMVGMGMEIMFSTMDNETKNDWLKMIMDRFKDKVN